MDHHICLGNNLDDGFLHRITDLVGHHQWHMIIQFKVQFDEIHTPGTPCAQVMDAPHTRVRAGNLDNFLSSGLWQLLIQQLTDRVSDKSQAAFSV